MDPLLAPRPLPVRRHSTALPARRLSRPYRSSPLAGPALSPAAPLPEPPRVSSSPSLNTLAPRPRARRATITAHSSEHVPRPSTAPSKRTSLSLRFSRRAASPPPPPPPPPVPDRRRRSAVVPAPTPSTSRDPAENWLTATAAPKFSRLGLAADGVVLPVSAKAYAASVSSRTSRTSRPSSPTTSVRSADSASSRSALSLARPPSDTSIDTSPPASAGSSSRSPRVHWSPHPSPDEGDAPTAITPAAVAPLRRAWTKLLLALRIPRVRAP